jgi:Concanavalin A-like lectin/glucanases superfamily
VKNVQNNFGMWLFLAALVLGFCLVVASLIWVSPQYLLATKPIALSGSTATQPVPTDGLIAYYPFNGNANDESGNGHDGLVYGATLAPDRFGNPERSYRFNGISDYIWTNITASDFTDDFTIAAWVNFDNFDNSYPHILCGDHYFIILHGMGPVYREPIDHIAFYQQTGIDHEKSRRIGSLVSANPLQTGKWHLITIIKNDLHFSILVDDIPQGKSIAKRNIPLTGSSLYIGANIPGGGLPSGYIDGFIDDMRIYKRALSPSEIQTLFGDGGWLSP